MNNPVLSATILPTRGNIPEQSACLNDLVERALDDYFNHLDGAMPHDLHQLAISQVERPLLSKTLHYAGGNQTKAAKMLGISRATLRKKLESYGF